MKKDRKIKDLILSAIADKSRIKKAFTNVIVVFGGVAVIVLLADMIMVALEEVKAICWWIVENKTVVGWVLGIICVTLVGGYWVGKDDDIDDEGSRSSDDEAPINCMEEDKLNRGAFVLMLAETLQRLQANHSAAFFGLYAPWGDGKTSVVRLLKEYVKTNDNEKIAFVDFSPWMYIDQDNIGWKFYDEIANQLEKEGGESCKWLKRYATVLRLKYLHERTGSVNAILDAIGRIWFELFYDEAKVRARLNSALRESSRRVVIVIDDLDRLPKEDVCKFIRLIKAHGDFQNLVYMFLADEQVLADAVGDMAPNKGDDFGRRYLEKIIPISRQLPPCNGNNLLKMFKDKLRSIVAECFSDVSFEEIDFEMMIPYLSNMRDFKRLLQAITIDISFAKKRSGGSKCVGLHLGDFIALCVMREFERKFYARLPMERFNFQEACGWPYRDGAVGRDWIEQHLLSLASENGKRSVEKFVFERLGIESVSQFGEGSKQFKMKYTDSHEAIMGCRLAAHLYFSGYFMSEFWNVQVVNDDLHRMVDSIKSLKFPTAEICKLDSGGGLPIALYALGAVDVFADDSVSEFYISVLVRMGDMPLRDDVSLPQEVGEMYMRRPNIYDRVYISLLRYCQKLRRVKSGQSVGRLLFEIFKRENALTMLGRFIDIDEEKHQVAGADASDALFVKQDYDALKNLYHRRISDKQLDVGIVAHPSFYDLFRVWVKILRERNDNDLYRDFADANNKWLGDYTSLSKMLEFFADDKRAARDDSLAYAIDVDRMERFWTQEQIATIKATLECQTQLQEQDRLFLKCLEFVDDMKKKGGNFDADSQMNYLKSNVASS